MYAPAIAGRLPGEVQQPLGVAGGRGAAQIEVRPRSREPDRPNRALEPSIGADRLREPVERRPRLRRAPRRGASTGMPERECLSTTRGGSMP